MLIDRTHRTWALTSIVILAMATGLYVVYAQSSSKGPSGGSLVGLLFGVVGTLMMVFAGLLAGRKQVPFWRIGSAQFWLRGHLWLGSLSLPMILFHSGFGLGGRLEQVLWAFFVVVIASGFFGLMMQHFLPRLMTSRIPHETFQVQVPYLRKRNRLLADAMIAGQCEPIPLDSDPLGQQLTRLAQHADQVRTLEAGARSREEKEQVRIAKTKWLDHVETDDRGLFLDLARHAKQSGWVRTENDLASHLLKVYVFPGIAAEPPKKQKTEEASNTKVAAKPGSPLDQLRGKARPTASPADAKKPDVESSVDERPAEAEKPTLSPLEQLKQGAAKKKQETEGSDKPSSPLDQIRAQASGKSPRTDSQSSSTKEKASKGKTLEKRSAIRPAAVSGPVDSPPESDAIRELFRDRYAYSEKLAAELAGSIHPFVPGASESAVAADATSKVPEPGVADKAAAVASLLVDRYGYDRQLARAVADQVQTVLARESSGKAREESKPSGRESTGAAKDSDASAGADKPLSPLEQIKQKAAAKKGIPKDQPGGKSPLEQLRAKNSSGRPAATAAANAATPSKKSAPAKTADTKKKSNVSPLRTSELRSFYLKSVRPFLVDDGRTGRLADPTEASRAFSQMRATLPVELHESLATLQAYSQEHRQFAEQHRIHRWLHCWLALHIPFSVALFVLVAVHIVLALRVIPWDFPIRF